MGAYSLDVCHGVRALLIEKFPGDEVSVRANSDEIVVSLSGHTHELSRHEAVSLRRALGESLTACREFVHTVGMHRADGSYMVSRRGADSAGHSKVFEGFERLRELYDSLPAKFTAEDVDAPGVTGGRRHLLVRHFVEHPAFECALVSRQPLTVEKRDPLTRDSSR